MSFGIKDNQWINPDDNKKNFPCKTCNFWRQVPCGCNHGWCEELRDFTEDDDWCEFGVYDAVLIEQYIEDEEFLKAGI